MKVETKNKKFEPVVITLENKEEFDKLLHEIGRLTGCGDSILEEVYIELDNMRMKKDW